MCIFCNTQRVKINAKWLNGEKKMDVYEKMAQLGLTLPEAPGLGGIYSQTKEFGSALCYVSGSGPNTGCTVTFSGKVGGEYSLEQGQDAARHAVLNLLAILHKNIGDLNRIKTFVKLLCFVASENNFYQQPEVANAASQLLIDIFGEQAGRATRSAIGVNVLPGNIPFEIEAVLELKKKSA